MMVTHRFDNTPALQEHQFCANKYDHMRTHLKSSLAQVAFTHFVPCFFMGTVLLYLMDTFFPDELIRLLSDGMFSRIDYITGASNGLILAAIVVAYHLHRNRYLRKKGAHSRFQASRKTIRQAALVGFVSGVFDVLLILHSEGIIIVTVFVVMILGWHLKIFSRRMVEMLRPGAVATWRDVSELFRIYLTMLAGFTLLNATLEGAHLLAGTPTPFNFADHGGDIFLNSLYYTVVTMTTLGFGDIVPKTWDGKLFLIFQCLVSYVMFALVVGIVTRGVGKAVESTAEDERNAH